MDRKSLIDIYTRIYPFKVKSRAIILLLSLYILNSLPVVLDIIPASTGYLACKITGLRFLAAAASIVSFWCMYHRRLHDRSQVLKTGKAWLY